MKIINVAIFFLLVSSLYSQSIIVNECNYNKRHALKQNEFEFNLDNNSFFWVDWQRKSNLKEAVEEIKQCHFTSFDDSDFPGVFQWSRCHIWMFVELENPYDKAQEILLSGSINKDSFYIFNGNEIVSYEVSINNFKNRNTNLQISGFNHCYLTLPAHQKVTILHKKFHQIYDPTEAKLKLSMADNYERYYYSKNLNLILFYILVCGFLLSVLILIIAHYFFYRNKTLWIYAAYLFTVLMVIWRNFEWYSLHLNYTLEYIPWYISKTVETALVFLSYTFFVVYILDFKIPYSKIILKVFTLIFTTAIIIDIPLLIWHSDISYMLNSFLRITVSLISLIMVVLFWKTKHRLAKLIFLASSILILGELFSNFSNGDISTIIPTLAVVIEVIILTIVVSFWSYSQYKNQLKIRSDNDKLVAEKNEVMASMRRDFAQDIHDELGSTITKLMLEMYYQKSKANKDDINILDNLQNNLTKLSHQIREMIWLFDDGKTKFSELQSQIRETGNEFVFNTPRIIVYNMPSSDNDINLSLEIKRHLLSVVKEAMNNILKHSEAKTIKVECYIIESILSLIITDDGVNQNFDHKNVTGNGITNMRNRINKIGGMIDHNISTSGCTIKVTLDLKKMDLKTL